VHHARSFAPRFPPRKKETLIANQPRNEQAILRSIDPDGCIAAMPRYTRPVLTIYAPA